MKHVLIDLVFNTPAIWDKRHKQHHHRYILAREWERIATTVGITATEARTCWKNLRQEFGKQLKKSENLSGNAAVDDSGIIHWPYFSKLLFLQDQFPPRVTSCNSTDKLDESSTFSATHTADSDSENSVHSDEENCRPFRRLSTPNMTRLPDLDHTSPIPIDPLAPSSSTFHSASTAGYITKTGCKRQIDPQDDIGKQLLDLEKEKLKKNKVSYDPSDEDTGFFNSLLPYVRNLSPKDKFIFRMKVQQTLFELAFPQQQLDQQGTSFTTLQSTCAGNGFHSRISDHDEYKQSEAQMSDWNENVEIKFITNSDLQGTGCKRYDSP